MKLSALYGYSVQLGTLMSKYGSAVGCEPSARHRDQCRATDMSLREVESVMNRVHQS
jgi:hypothetical protein